MRTRRGFEALALAAALLPACAAIDPPEQFLARESGPSEVKAVAADGSLFRYREFRDGDRGGLPFWSEAVRRDLVEGRGYTLLEERAMENAEAPGAEYLFEVTAGGVARRYLLTVAVEGGVLADTIRVGEYTAEKDLFDAHLEAVRRTLSSR